MIDRAAFLRVSLRLLEFAFFAAAFVLLVPAVPSVEGQTYSLVPTLIIGGTLFAGSLGLTLYRKADSIVFSVLALLFYFALAWAIHERVWSF